MEEVIGDVVILESGITQVMDLEIGIIPVRDMDVNKELVECSLLQKIILAKISQQEIAGVFIATMSLATIQYNAA